MFIASFSPGKISCWLRVCIFVERFFPLPSKRQSNLRLIGTFARNACLISV